MELNEEIFYRLANSKLSQEEALVLLKELSYECHPETQKRVYKEVKRLSIDSYLALSYQTKGVAEKDSQTLGLLEAILGTPLEQINSEKVSQDQWHFYSINKRGHIIKLLVNGQLLFFPEEICFLKYLETLHLSRNQIAELPECIKNLKLLKDLNLSYNNLISLPLGLKLLPQLKSINLQNDSGLFYLDNILDYIGLEEFESEITVTKIKKLMVEKLKMLKQAKLKPWNFEISERVFPPNDVLENRDYKYILLWMLDNNETCVWNDFTNEPLRLVQSKLSYYLNDLLNHQHIEKLKGFYRITPLGTNMIRRMEESLSDSPLS